MPAVSKNQAAQLVVVHLLESLQKIYAKQFVRRKWKSLAPELKWLEAQMSKAFRAQGKEVLALFGRMFGSRFRVKEGLHSRLTEADITPPDDLGWTLLFSQLPEYVQFLMVNSLASSIQKAFALGGDHLMQDFAKGLAKGLVQDASPGFGISFDLKNPRAVAFLEAHAAELVKGINETTRKRIAQLVTEGIRQGTSYSKIAQAIKDEFAEMGAAKPQKHIRNRAELIAVTELGNAYEAGTELAAKNLTDLGLDIEKSWLTVGDARVTQGCRTNAGAGWIPEKQLFPSGHQRPLRFPGCRCTNLRRMAQDVVPLPGTGGPQEPPRTKRERTTIMGFSYNLEAFESVDAALTKGEKTDLDG